MARPRRIQSDLVAQARQVARQTQDLTVYRQALAVLLPADLSASLEQTAQVLGVGRATVHRLQVQFRNQRPPEGATRKRWGGRRRALLSPQAEKDFLQPWAAQAQTGGVLVVAPLRAALAQRLGRPVAASGVYRFLARPDTRHPKADPQVQEDWKKNCRKCWRTC